MYLPINLRYTYNNPDMAENIIQGEPSYLQQMLDGELGEIIIAIPDIKDHLLKGMTYLLIGSDSINTISLYETLIGDKHDER
jgi:hypothetical protein